MVQISEAGTPAACWKRAGFSCGVEAFAGLCQHPQAVWTHTGPCFSAPSIWGSVRSASAGGMAVTALRAGTAAALLSQSLAMETSSVSNGGCSAGRQKSVCRSLRSRCPSGTLLELVVLRATGGHPCPACMPPAGALPSGSHFSFTSRRRELVPWRKQGVRVPESYQRLTSFLLGEQEGACRDRPQVALMRASRRPLGCCRGSAHHRGFRPVGCRPCGSEQGRLSRGGALKAPDSERAPAWVQPGHLLCSSVSPDSGQSYLQGRK